MTGNVNVDPSSRYVLTLQTQAKTAEALPADALPCPYCTHRGRIFQHIDQLYDHALVDHSSRFHALEPAQARAHLQDAALRM